MSTMRAVEIKDGKGPASAMHIASIPKPSPSTNQALVHIKAFGLNRMDLLQREGKYPVPPQAPATLGVEFSGVIEALGPIDTSSTRNGQESPFREGDEVFGLAYGGAYAEYIAVSTGMLIHKPAELSWETCAGVPETWITALQAMYLIGEWDQSPGKTILWHAGASSVSIAGIQLSRANGAKAVYATARSDDKCAFCVDELGADQAFNATAGDGNWARRVLDATDGRGVDVIVDFVGGSYFGQNLEAAARDARIVNLATLGGTKVEDADLSRFVSKRIRFEGSSLRSRDEAYQGKLRDQLVEHALPKMRAGEFKISVEVFDWEQIVQAHELMESNKTKGKIICTIPWS